jgi:arylsulfatase A-like enzyme
VPLVLSGCGIESGKRIEEPVRLVDVLPTILDLLGIHDMHRRDGSSLTPLLSGSISERIFPAYSETFYREELKLPGLSALGPWISIRHGNELKTIVDVKSSTIATFDLQRDPAERFPVLLGPRHDIW